MRNYTFLRSAFPFAPHSVVDLCLLHALTFASLGMLYMTTVSTGDIWGFCRGASDAGRED